MPRFETLLWQAAVALAVVIGVEHYHRMKGHG